METLDTSIKDHCHSTMPATLDIINLIEKNPITRLSSDYQHKLVNKVKETFTESQQQLFLSSFYCYLNCDSKDFVISLDNVWKWVGFFRKDAAKKVFLKHFIENVDYIINKNIPPIGGKPQGGRPEETILMTIRTFKKFCMKAKTKKADEIHDYYLKMEELLQETIEEETEELRVQLQIKDQKIEKKDSQLRQQQVEIDKLKKKKNMLYIGHTPIIKNLIKIGITEDLSRRLEQHKSSNPKFEYLFTMKTENAVLIEKMIKILLSNYRVTKPEWFQMTYIQMKDTLDFVVMMYDTYQIQDSVENLTTFVMRYNKNRLCNSSTTRQYYLQNHYEKFVKDCIIKTNDECKTPMSYIIDKFEDYVDENNIPSSKNIRSNIGNISTSFVKEFKEKMDEIFEIKSGIYNISDNKRGIFVSKSVGWIGVDLKDINTCIFSEDVYKKFCNEKLEVTGDRRDKIVGNFLIKSFLSWCDNNNIKPLRKNSIKQRGKYSNFFQNEFQLHITKFTGKEFYKKRTFRGVSGVFWYLRFDKIVDRGNN